VFLTKEIKMEKFIAGLFMVAGALAFLVFLSFLLSWPVYMLWNGCLVDAVSGVKEVTWQQAWGINLLCGIMFNGTSSK
jgi:hypothetical protein